MPEGFVDKKESRKGLLTVIDGLDGIGKGVIERALIEYEQKLGRAVFDTVAFSRANRKGLPELKDFWNPPETYFDAIITGEPTYTGVGHNIRNEIVARNGRDYSSEVQIEAYSLDRQILMQRVGIPALQNGLRDIRSRCVASTLCYQSLAAVEEAEKLASGELSETERQQIIDRTRERILSHEGNQLALEWAPDLLIIPTIDDPSELIKRIEARSATQKDDKVIFETLGFQTKLKPFYEEPWLKDLFENHGTRVEYLDAGISPDETRNQAVNIYRTFLKDKSLRR